MESNYYQIYTDACIALAKSIVIKSSQTATAVNDYIVLNYGANAVDTLNESTWKYYLNLSGQYHTTDEIMKVVSLDTLQIIDFTIENLQHHKTTADAYKFGSTLYLELVNKYPKQERLILGVLYPCDIDKAINSTDGTILSYPGFLVEDYEYSFINRLQDWIYGYWSRWNVEQFNISDDLYSTTMLGVLYLNLIPAILTLRLKACKTNEAHSYHIRQYLASHGLLDGYLRYLTRNQALFLYRNIAYIERNSGKQDTFDWLIQHIMTERGLPIASYEMRHDLSNMPGQLKPILSFNKKPINTTFNYDLINTFTAKQVFDKELGQARDNAVYYDEEFASSTAKMSYSIDNRLNTKLLESSLIDYEGSEHYTLASILYNHWIYFSNTGLYNTFISFESPANGETISLTTKDAFVFYIFAFSSTVGVNLLNIPKYKAVRVIRNPLPSLSDLKKVVESSRVSDSFAQEMLSSVPSIPAMISTNAFYNYCEKLQQAAEAQYYRVCSENSMNAKVQKQNLVSLLWCDKDVILGDSADQNYAAWFASRNININLYTQENLASVANILLAKSTGLSNTDSITLKDIQAKMVSLMARLSSYSVQFVTQINSLPIIDAPNSTVRLDDINGLDSSGQYIRTGVDAFWSNSTDLISIGKVYGIIPVKERVDFKASSLYDTPITVGVTNKTVVTQHIYVQAGVGASNLVES